MRGYSQTGFTLIELMIVVAIIGIISVAAIGSYKSYIARVQALDAISLMGGAGDAIDELVMQTGSFPVTTTELSSLGIRISGKYLATTAIQSVSDDTGTLVGEFHISGVSRGLAGTTLYFSRQTNGSWECISAGANPAPLKFLPRNCH